MDNEPVKNTENTEPEKEQKGQEPIASDLEKRIKELEAENGKLRQANTNASADASKWKKQYQEKLSEEDRKKEEQQEAEAALRQELETLKAERNVANHKAQLLSIGFDDTTAQDVAKAINDGDTANIFAGIRRFITAHDKTLKENAFRNNPTLQGGNATGKAITKEQFDAMGYKERLEVFEQHPDLYNEYTQ